MSVSYINAGSEIRATQLNALINEMEAIYRCLYGDKSPYIYEVTGFSPASLKVAFGTDSSWKIIPLHVLVTGFPTAAYDHSAFTTAAAALTVATYDTPLELAYVDLATPWPLDGSIEAHKVDYLGTDHYYFQRLATDVYGVRERYRRLAVLDVFLEALGGALTWEEEWNKYHFIRFHNLDPSTNVVTLPDGGAGVELSLGPFEVKTARRSYPAGNTWTTGMRYFWPAESGDSVFWDADPDNTVGSLAMFHTYVAQIIDAASTTFGFKASEFWDGSAKLNEAIDTATKLRRYAFHAGRMISWEAASSGTPVPHDFTPTWVDLEAGTNGVKYNPATFALESDSGATTPVDVVGIGSNIAPYVPVTLPLDLFSTTTYFLGQANAAGFAYTPTEVGDYNLLTMDGDTFIRWPVAQSFFNSTASTIEETLATVSTLASVHSYRAQYTGGTTGTTYQGLTAPTVTLGSDGWKIYSHGTQDIPHSSGFIPTQAYLMQCTTASGKLVHHWGGALLDRLLIKAQSKTHGRRLSPYVGYTDLFDVVFHDGHPDLTGTYGLAGGVEWVESRSDNSTSAAKYDLPFPTNRTGTQTAVVYPLADSIERIAANSTDASWYATNRTALLAGGTELSDRQHVVRVYITAEQYNQVAGLLNSVMTIAPFTFDEMLYYGAGGSGNIVDGTWAPGATWDTGGSVYAVPVNYYCAVASSGSRADSMGITVTSSPDHYITTTGVRDWCDSMGIRFFVRRLTGFRRYVSGIGVIPTTSTAEDRRVHLGTGAWVCDMSADGSGYYLTPPLTSCPEEIEITVRAEHAQGDGPTLPTGWQLAGDDYVVVKPERWVNYSGYPTYTAGLPEETYEIVHPYTSFGAAPTTADYPAFVYPASTFDNSDYSTAEIEGLAPTSYDSTAPSDLFQTPNAPWGVYLCNRFVIQRT